MKKYLYILFMLGFLVEGLIFFDIYKRKNITQVLGETVGVVPTPTIIPSPSPSSSPLPTIKPTLTPTPTPVPQPQFSSEQIYEFIERFAGQYSVSPDILRHLAICESGFNAMASNLHYGGLFQFNPSTWANIRREMGEDTSTDLRFNAEEAVQTAAYVLHINKAYIWPNCTP